MRVSLPLLLAALLPPLVSSHAPPRCDPSTPPADVPDVPKIPQDQVYTTPTSSLSLTAHPPPSFPRRTTTLVCVALSLSRDQLLLGPFYHAHDATTVTFCSPSNQPLVIYGVPAGHSTYDVWSEYPDESKADGVAVTSCALPLTIHFQSPLPTPQHATHITTLTQAKYGLMLTLMSDTYVGSSLRYLGEWEDTIVGLLSSVIRYGDVVWEGGGHVGSHTVALGRLVGEAGHVYSYEAHPTTRAVLGANIVMNGLQSVVNVIPMGVGETNGVIEIGGGCSNVCKDSGVECVDACDEGSKQQQEEGRFVLGGGGENSGGFSFTNQETLPTLQQQPVKEMEKTRGPAPPVPSTVAPISRITVDVVRMDDAVTKGYVEATCPRVIKTDLEGMDLRALKGAARTISECRPMLYMEAFAPMRKHWPDIEAFVVKGMGYKCFHDSFMPFPSRGRSFFEIEENGYALLPDRRCGAMSFNYVCHHPSDERASEVLSEAQRQGRVSEVKDVNTDAIYVGPDCNSLCDQYLVDGGMNFDFVFGEGRRSFCKT